MFLITFFCGNHKNVLRAVFALPGKLWRDDKRDWSDDVRQKLRARQKKVAYLLLNIFGVINFNPAAVNSPDFACGCGWSATTAHRSEFNDKYLWTWLRETSESMRCIEYQARISHSLVHSDNIMKLLGLLCINENFAIYLHSDLTFEFLERQIFPESFLEIEDKPRQMKFKYLNKESYDWWSPQKWPFLKQPHRKICNGSRKSIRTFRNLWNTL